MGPYFNFLPGFIDGGAPLNTPERKQLAWRCRIPLVTLYSRLGIAAAEQYYRRRLPRLAGHVSRMPMDRLPRQLHAGPAANNRPTGSPLMTWGRTLKKALIKCGQSPSFAAWRQAAADRMFLRQMCGRFALPPRLRPVRYAG